MNETPTTTGTPSNTLAPLRAELMPIVLEAARTSPSAGWLSVRVNCHPLAVHVVLHDETGATGTFVGTPTPELAETVAALLGDCLAALPLARRRAVEAYVERHPEAPVLLSDAELASVRVLLDPGGDADLLELGLVTDETRH